MAKNPFRRLTRRLKPTILTRLKLFAKKQTQAIPAPDTKPVTEATLDKQRREIFKRARAFIRPLALAKHRALLITAGILTGSILLFLSVIAVMIYRYQSDNSLVYQVSRVIPYPAAKINGTYVTYGDYLFELRPLKHFFGDLSGPASSGREAVDFSTPAGTDQLRELERMAFDELTKKVLVRQLADEHGISVSRAEVDEAVANQINQAGGERQFKEVIGLYYRWTEGDFRRDLTDKLLRRKLLPVLSEEQRDRAEDILAQVRGGTDFAKVAKAHSDDPGSRGQGGDLGVAPRGTYVHEFEAAALALEPGQVSEVVASQHGFHVIKLIAKTDDSLHAAHILINYADFDTAIAADLQTAETRTCFIWNKACIEIPPKQ